jgi:methionyl aminopeptidase
MSKLAAMREGGRRLRAVRAAVSAQIKPGVKLRQLDALADELIVRYGGQAAFKRVPGYGWATCINVNQGVVHGIPLERIIQDGDVASLDVGMIYRGWHTDTSTTVIAGRQSAATSKLLRVGQAAVAAAIKQARVGNRVGQISLALEQVLRRGGMSPVKTLTGHGIGRMLHEWPPIPCFLEGRIEDTGMINEGMSLAIEAIYTAGRPETKVAADGWTVVTADGSLAGLFEETVFVTDQGPLVVT